jgi:hypothetical protein
MKKLSISIIFLCFSAIGFCQDHFYKSSIITQDGNIVNGYISNIYDAKTITYKETFNSKPVIYKPQQIKGFVLADNMFETKIVRFNHYKYGSSYLGVTGEVASVLTIDNERGQTTDTVFCQKILAGTVNLYKLQYSDNAQYLLVEKNNVIREVPRQYYVTDVNASAKGDVLSMVSRKQATLNYTSYEYRTYIDTIALVCNDANFVKELKSFNYSEKKIISVVASYNRKMGTPNGGLIKNKVPKELFYGGGIGKVAWKRDENFRYEQTDYSMAASGYILMPLSGINRNASAKFGVNYFVYGNNRRSLTVFSASLGFRYAALSGIIRPYGGFSLALSEQFVNNKPYSTLVPSILEGGIMVPVRDFYITLGVNLSPLKYSYNNAYKLFAWQVGILF